MAMCNMNKQLVKIAHVVPEIHSCSDKRTDRQTDRHGVHNTPLCYRGRVMMMK